MKWQTLLFGLLMSQIDAPRCGGIYPSSITLWTSAGPLIEVFGTQTIERSGLSPRVSVRGLQQWGPSRIYLHKRAIFTGVCDLNPV